MLDLMFLLTESQENPRHVGAALIFQRPRRGGARMVGEIVDAFRHAEPVPPFNRIPVLLRTGLPEWQEVARLDMDWHVQHMKLPAPGTDAQLDELVAELHAPILGRDRPGWRVHVIDGLQRNRFAIFIKVHHSLVDGESGIALVHDSLSRSPRDRRIRSVISTALPVRHKAVPGSPLQWLEHEAEGLARQALSVGWGSVLEGRDPAVHRAADADERTDPQRAGRRAHDAVAAGHEGGRARLGRDAERRRAVRAGRRHEPLPAGHRPGPRARARRDLPGFPA